MARIIGQAFYYRFKRLHLLRQTILPPECFGDQQQRRNFGLSPRGELKGAPGGLQSAVILGRRAGKLCFSEGQPMIGIAIAKPDAFFQGSSSSSEIAPRGGILRAPFGAGALLRRATGGEAALQALLIGAGFLGQAGQIKALRPGKGWGQGQHQDQQKARQLHRGVPRQRQARLSHVTRRDASLGFRPGGMA